MIHLTMFISVATYMYKNVYYYSIFSILIIEKEIYNQSYIRNS